MTDLCHDAEALARALLAHAAVAPDPEPLLEAARALLEHAKAGAKAIDFRDSRRA